MGEARHPPRFWWLKRLAIVYALALLTLLIVFNVGRASALAQARKCPTPVQTWTVPFKGTLP